jgi:hypothetical protein
MTAEIAILNKNGVALAADSKVTIGTTGQEKTFDTVNKLFTLSKVHPVGLMISAMPSSWATLGKQSSNFIGNEREHALRKKSRLGAPIF